MTDENAYALLFTFSPRFLYHTTPKKRHLFAKIIAVIFQDWPELSVLLAQ